MADVLLSNFLMWPGTKYINSIGVKNPIEVGCHLAKMNTPTGLLRSKHISANDFEFESNTVFLKDQKDTIAFTFTSGKNVACDRNTSSRC